MRWLLVKDLQILRRSPLLVSILVLYPAAIALMIGFALSSPPGKPRVAIYTGVKPGHGKVHLGTQQVDVSQYARELFSSIQPLQAASAGEATADVRQGRAVAALIIPADITQQLQALLQGGNGNPTVQLVLNTSNPLERNLADQAIQARVDAVEQTVSKQVLKVVVHDLQQVLNGGVVNLLGQNVPLLGLRNVRTIVTGTVQSLPRDSKLLPALHQVVAFADIAIEGLAFAGPEIGTIGAPLSVQRIDLAGRTTPTASYAVSIAAVVSLMFVTLLLAAGLLALERSENAYSRLIRGLVSPATLLGEKILLSGAAATALALALAAIVSIFVPLEWARFELWVLALAASGLAFAALGVAIGGLAREVSTASLMAFLLSLPVAFLALVPSTAVSGGVGTALGVVSFVFPFRAGLQAVSNAFSGAAPGMAWPLLHLLVLALVFGVLARLALRRFASR
ncbi:MAG TPA: ABC transporter permease [Solirubrobacteraceae bacterium]|jgi:ABC-2 type transport system permease protein|nr:ABC transporter permease [Solirubrobacteraceae bacterium]